MAEELHLDIVTTAESAGLRQAEKDLKETRAEADKLGDSFDDMGKAADKATHEVHGAGVETKTFQVEIEKSTKRLKEMEQQLLSLGNDKSLRKAIRSERSWLAELERSAKDFVEVTARTVLPAAVSSFGEVFKQVGVSAPKAMMPALIAGIVGGVGALLPGLGAMIGGTLAGATATAAMAAGIFSASKDPGVIAAAKHFGADLSHEFFKSDAFVQPTIDALDKLGTTFKSINIGSSLAKLAPTVTVIADGIGRLVTNFMPGFNTFLDRMGPYAKVAADGLANTGQALSVFFDEITQSPGALEGLNMFFRVTNGLVIMLGKSLHFLSDTFHVFLSMNARFFGDLEDIASFLPGPLDKAAARMNNLFEELLGGSSSGVIAITQMKDSLDPFNRYLKEAAENTEGLGRNLDDLFNTSLIVEDAVIGFEKSVDDLTRAIYDNGHSIDVRTEKGRAVRSAILDEVQAAIRLRDANILTGISAADANIQFNAQIAALKEAALKADVNKEALEALIGNYVVTVTTTYKTIGKPPTFLQGNLSEPAQDASHRAAGGPVTAGVPYMINERGRETVTFPANGTVRPANLSPVGGGGTVRVILDLFGVEDDFVKRIRRAARIEGGGDVQVAFGN